jgi:hypothetical protein
MHQIIPTSASHFRLRIEALAEPAHSCSQSPFMHELAKEVVV